MPNVKYYDDHDDERRMTDRECAEVYNALCDRVSALKTALLPELPERVRASLEQSLADCERLMEVFE